MESAPIPQNEKERLISLHNLGLLDTEPEERFDRITRLATKFFKVPISTLTLVDAEREWFKSCQGLPQREGDRAISFCGHALLANDVFVIPDTKLDPRFSDNPMVSGKPYIRFYAGVPLMNADGQRIGVFCIKDLKPRNLSPEESAIFKDLAAWAEVEINSRNLNLALAEQKKLQAEITLHYKVAEESRAKEEAILDSVGDGFVVVDKEGIIMEMSNAAGELLGVRPVDCKGKQYNDIWSVKNEKGETLALNERPVQIAFTTGQKVSTSIDTGYYYSRPDGKQFPVAITVAPVILNNQIIGAVDVFRDITKEKEVDKAKSEFVSLASHQLRTPPTTIKWFLGMLLSEEVGELNAKQKEYFKEIDRNNERVITLVNALLNVSRIDLGTFYIEPESTDIVALTKGIIKDLNHQIKDRDLRLKEIYSAGLPLVSVDPKLLGIAIQNVISNAVKYTPAKGAIDIEIFVKRNGESVGGKTMSRDSLIILVSDTGYGIPPDQQDKIYMKLFRASNVKDKDTDGTGLGLYLAKSIIDHTEGDIWFESELNKGTTFYLAIKLEGMKKREGTTKLIMGSTG